MGAVQMGAPYHPPAGALLTFFKTASRCFLVIPEWRQAAFRHAGRSDTCKCKAVAKFSQSYSTLCREKHQTLGPGRTRSEPASYGPGHPGDRGLDGDYWALGCATLRKVSWPLVCAGNKKHLRVSEVSVFRLPR